jgi:hypothetical protein
MTRRFKKDSDATLSLVRARLTQTIATMNDTEIALVLSFADQVVACYDPDAISDFLEFRSDATLASILQLAAALDDEGREQLLYSAEDFFDQRNHRTEE